jgi:hypothetical protein
VEAVAGPRGTLALAWTTSRGGRAYGAVAPPGRGFGAPVTLSRTEYATNLRLTVDGADRLTAAWTQLLDGGSSRTEVLRMSDRDSRGLFRAPRTVLSLGGGGTASVELAAERSGRMAAAWHDGRTVMAGFARRGGTFRDPGPLDLGPDPPLGGGQPRLAMAPNGWALATVTTGGSHDRRVLVAARAPGRAGFGRAAQVFHGTEDPLSGAITTPVAVNGRGRGVIGLGIRWAGDRRTHALVLTGSAGEFSEPHDLGRGGTPLIGIDESGTSTVVWHDGEALRVVTHRP